MSHRKRGAGRGLTLIELLTVIFIVGLLVAMLVPATLKMRDRGKAAKAAVARASLRTAILNYHADYGEWPIADSSQKTTVKSSEVITKLRPDPTDPKSRLFWEGVDQITDQEGREYSVTFNPDGRYPINPEDDFDRNLAVYFSVEANP